MRRSRFTEEQIIAILAEQERGAACVRRHGKPARRIASYEMLPKGLRWMSVPRSATGVGRGRWSNGGADQHGGSSGSDGGDPGAVGGEREGHEGRDRGRVRRADGPAPQACDPRVVGERHREAFAGSTERAPRPGRDRGFGSSVGSIGSGLLDGFAPIRWAVRGLGRLGWSGRFWRDPPRTGWVIGTPGRNAGAGGCGSPRCG